GGHLGIEKLTEKVRIRFYWPGWQEAVREWCQKCLVCGARKASSKTPQAPLVLSLAKRPLERVALDIVGPFPSTPRGKKYILVAADYFTRWTEAYSLPDQEAKTVARVLIEEFICRYGTPCTIHTDQGRNFESTFFQELCTLLDIDKTRTTPYHPQSDGLVERFNRTLTMMLSMFVEANQSNWDQMLPFVMMAYRSSVQSSTGSTPFKVLFGREITLPVDVVMNIKPEQEYHYVSEYVQQTASCLQSMAEAVQCHQASASQKQKAYFDLKVTPHTYEVGEYVWVRRGLSPKLQRRFKGPFRVVRRITDVLYAVDPGEGKQFMTLHHNRLKPYHGTLPENQNQGQQRDTETPQR
uniref:Gypsy retrotransposon integrase-like protein 1 n=1 Tax=Latimeria chalumnae TaxID=7897 RepID=H2ZRT1_LATCH